MNYSRNDLSVMVHRDRTVDASLNGLTGVDSKTHSVFKPEEGHF